jgi:cellulose synthase/poly-beta-1,6-N-acetylglucosamine synthase-like glycosyltransferase
MVGGTVRAHSTSPIGNAIALAVSTPFGVGGARFRYTDEEEETDTVFMGFCRRSVFQKLGGFDEELVRNQDDEFSYRLTKAGGRIICNPGIASTYYNRATLKSLWNQYFQYGYWKVRVLQKHPLQMRLRQFVPPTFVLGLLGTSLLTFSSVLRHLSIALPMMYLVANLTVSIILSFKNGRQYLLLLPLVFLILHVSYGLGFLIGLVKFAKRWGDRSGKIPDWPIKKVLA